jgi:hypothetical protein
MRLDRRPLLDTALDADLFVDRVAVLDRLTRAAELGLNAAVSGTRGAGKTSLLRRVAWLTRGAAGPGGRGAGTATAGPPDRRVLHVSGAAGDASGLLATVLQRLGGRADDGAAAADLIEALGQLLSTGARVDLTQPGAATGPVRPLVVVDDLATQTGRELFGVLRDEIWALSLTWLVAVADADTDAVLRPPVDAFFEVVTELEPLAPADAAELVGRRLGDNRDPHTLPAPDLDRIVRASGGHPRRLIDLTRAVVVDGIAVDDVLDSLIARDERRAQVSRGAAQLAAELDALGSASPSDQALQDRMAVSRPRLVTLFSELKAAGLVEESIAPREGPGRPRIVYRLRSAGPSSRPPAATSTTGATEVRS